MVGVRNPIRTRRPQSDDGAPRSAEVWINELRLSDFREDGGWAANAQMQARLADLGTVNLVGQTSTPGWGSIDKNVNQRSMEQVIQYDLSSNLELGKFFPEKAGIRIPVYMGYSENRIDRSMTRLIRIYSHMMHLIILRQRLSETVSWTCQRSIRAAYPHSQQCRYHKERREATCLGPGKRHRQLCLQ
jgi:cell surface protein SprA